MTDCSSGTIWYWNDRLHVCWVYVCTWHGGFLRLLCQKLFLQSSLYVFMSVINPRYESDVWLFSFMTVRWREPWKKCCFFSGGLLLCGFKSLEHTLEYTALMSWVSAALDRGNIMRRKLKFTTNGMNRTRLPHPSQYSFMYEDHFLFVFVHKQPLGCDYMSMHFDFMSVSFSIILSLVGQKGMDKVEG